MSAAAFPSPAAEMAEMNRLQYELDYTEGISQRMRIPEMLKVAPQSREDPASAAASILGPQDVHHSVIMQVPERIVVAGRSVGQSVGRGTHGLKRFTARNGRKIKTCTSQSRFFFFKNFSKHCFHLAKKKKLSRKRWLLFTLCLRFNAKHGE